MSKHSFGFKTPRIMGILNLTEDSFSDGARYLDHKSALEHAAKMIADGAEIIDIGAESTRPGALPVPMDLELQRIIPVLEAIKSSHPLLLCSIDTRKAEVAKRCIALGAEIINDISALRYDPEMVRVMADNLSVKLILMHMQGDPETMQVKPHYTDVISEIDAFFTERIGFCVAHGIKKENIMIDPGIGFGKDLEHNLEIISRLDAFSHFGSPLVLGASRKRFINAIVPSEPMSRLGGTLATAVWGMFKGADILRVHDVFEHHQFIRVMQAIAAKEEQS